MRCALTEAGVGVRYQPKAQGGQGAGVLLDASVGLTHGFLRTCKYSAWNSGNLIQR